MKIKHELINSDTYFVGTAVEIIEQMRVQSYFERGASLDDYIDNLVCLINRVGKTDHQLPGKTLEEKAECFIELMKLEYFKEA
jgi:hypothetical protein